MNQGDVEIQTVQLTIRVHESKALYIEGGAWTGGNIRSAKRMRVTWNNGTSGSVRLTFEEWEIDRRQEDGPPEPVWPFTRVSQSDKVKPGDGTVTIERGGSFTAKLAGLGRMIVKYRVDALQADGRPDSSILPLDPMIIIER